MRKTYRCGSCNECVDNSITPGTHFSTHNQTPTCKTFCKACDVCIDNSPDHTTTPNSQRLQMAPLPLPHAHGIHASHRKKVAESGSAYCLEGTYYCEVCDTCTARGWNDNGSRSDVRLRHIKLESHLYAIESQRRQRVQAQKDANPGVSMDDVTVVGNDVLQYTEYAQSRGTREERASATRYQNRNIRR